MRYLLSCVLLCCASPTFAQDKKIDLAIVTFATAATADWVTTHRNLRTPGRVSADGLTRTEFRELNPLIGWAADSPWLMYTVAAGLDTAGVYAWHRLTKNHTKIRAIGLYAAAAARFGLAYRNTRVLHRLRAETN